MGGFRLRECEESISTPLSLRPPLPLLALGSSVPSNNTSAIPFPFALAVTVSHRGDSGGEGGLIREGNTPIDFFSLSLSLVLQLPPPLPSPSPPSPSLSSNKTALSHPPGTVLLLNMGVSSTSLPVPRTNDNGRSLPPCRCMYRLQGLIPQTLLLAISFSQLPWRSSLGTGSGQISLGWSMKGILSGLVILILGRGRLGVCTGPRKILGSASRELGREEVVGGGSAGSRVSIRVWKTAKVGVVGVVVLEALLGRELAGEEKARGRGPEA